MVVIEIHRSHRWGMLSCERCGKGHPVWSTPKDPDTFARRLDRFTREHGHRSGTGNVLKLHRQKG